MAAKKPVQAAKKPVQGAERTAQGSGEQRQEMGGQKRGPSVHERLGSAIPASSGKGGNMFLMAFLASIVIISWQEIKTFKRLPLPSRFLSAGVAYGMLAIAEPLIEDLAGWLAWGLFTGLLYAQLGGTSPKVPKVANSDVPTGVTPIPLTLSKNTGQAKGPSSSGGGGYGSPNPLTGNNPGSSAVTGGLA